MVFIIFLDFQRAAGDFFWCFQTFLYNFPLFSYNLEYFLMSEKNSTNKFTYDDDQNPQNKNAYLVRKKLIDIIVFQTVEE